MVKSLINSYLGAVGLIISAGFSAPVYGQTYLEHYNPQKGFTSATPNLSRSLLKLAGSLEAHGSPEPFIRHALAENARVDKKYREAFGEDLNVRPAYLDDKFIKTLIGEWRKIEAPLKLQRMSRECGKHMRHAILGSWNKTAAELTEEETKLTPEQKARYQALVAKEHFRKSDFDALEAFYAPTGGFENLTENGQGQMARRVLLGTKTPEEREKLRRTKGSYLVKLLVDHQKKLEGKNRQPNEKGANVDSLEKSLIDGLKLEQDGIDFDSLDQFERDALWHSHMLKAFFQSRWRKLDEKLSKKGSEATKAVMHSMARNLLVIAHIEFLAGIREQMVDSR